MQVVLGTETLRLEFGRRQCVQGGCHMGAIVDILLLGRDEITLLKKRYPDCVLKNLTNTSRLTQQYRFIAPSEDLDDESYYEFLLDNMIATCSTNFRSRLESDEKFAERMRARVATTLTKLQASTSSEVLFQDEGNVRIKADEVR